MLQLTLVYGDFIASAPESRLEKFEMQVLFETKIKMKKLKNNLLNKTTQ